MTTILQKEITLDQAIIEAYKNYTNGCGLRLVVLPGPGRSVKHWLEYGCVGVLPSGLLTNWISGTPYPSRRDPSGRFIDEFVSQETLLAIKSSKPCAKCGGARFRTAPLDDTDAKG